jgi:hypothetical protein
VADRRQQAIERLRTVCGIGERRAAKIVDALTALAADDALAPLLDDDAVESSLAEQRLARLRRLTTRVGELLSDAEVAAVFAVRPTVGRSLNQNLRARFPALAETLVDQMLKRGRAKQAEGAEDDEIRYEISYDDASAFELALDRLKSLGMTRGLVVDRPRQRLVVPHEMTDRGGGKRDPRAALGLKT